MKEVVIHDNTVNGHVNWLLGVVKSSSNLSKTNTSMLTGEMMFIGSYSAILNNHTNRFYLLTKVLLTFLPDIPVFFLAHDG